jgi:phospholipid/cholesterol/gamma-HCH transport system substrate-binding protein
MPRSLITEFRVGMFVSTGLLLAMVTIFLIGSEHRFFERFYTLYANFQTISGLRAGATVQLAGIKVGFVDGIRLPAEIEKKEITVVLRIRKQFQDRIRADSTATVETQGLLGDKYIYVTMGSEAQPILPDKGLIPSKETASIFALADKAGKIMDDIGKASDALTEMLTSVKGTKGEGDLKVTIKSIRTTIEEIETGKGALHSLIYDPKSGQMISDLSRAVRGAADIMSKADAEGEGKAAGILVNMRHASADLREILSSIRRGEGTAGRLVMDPGLYDDLRSLFGKANRNALLRAVIRSTVEENDRQVLK